MENYNIPIKVEIKAVSMDKGVVLVANSENPEGSWVHVVAPCKLDFIKKGEAYTSFDEEGNICYCKMLPTGGETSGYVKPDKPYSGGSWQKKPSSGYKKPYNSATQENPLKPANEISEHNWKNEVKVFEGLTLKEFEITYKLLGTSNSFVVATQSFQKPTLVKTTKDSKTGEEIIHNLYDFIVYMKVKKEDKSEDLPDY